MALTTLHAAWLPTDAAAAAFGIHRRTLQRRARMGQVESRPGPGGVVLYAIPGAALTATSPPAPPAAPSNTPPHDTTWQTGAPATTATPAGDLGAALVAMMDRTVRAELDAAAARAELATVRAELATMTRQAVQAHIRWQAARAGRDAALAQLEARRRA
jgi:hypothetical protein